MLSFDVAVIEQRLGVGPIRSFDTQNPFASPSATRQVGFSADPDNPTALVITDSGTPHTEFDISVATALRLYYDVNMAGGTFLDLFVIPLAAEFPGSSGGKPQLKTPVNKFQPRTVVLSSSDGPLKASLTPIRFTATQTYSSVIVRRPAIAVAFGVVSDSALNGLALAIQPVMGLEGD